MSGTHFQRRAVARVIGAIFALTLPTMALADSGTSNSTSSAAADNTNHGTSGSTSSGASSNANNSAASSPRSGYAPNRVTDDLWQRLDTNGDGQVSRAEFNAYHRGNAMNDRSSAQALTALGREVRASDLIGMDVHNRSGEDLGQIKDLIVDTSSGKVRSAILSFGGVLGVGDKLFRYPLSSFSRGSSDELVLNVDDETLKSTKGFDRDNWVERKDPNVWQASRLMGKDVVDRNGEHLGEIQDLAIDTRAGKVHYALLKYDRPWSLDNPLVAMPLGSFNFGDGRHDVSLNVDRAQIDAQAGSHSNVASNDPQGRVVTERWIFLFPTTTTAAQSGSQSNSAQNGRASNSSTAGAASSAGEPSRSNPSNLKTSANPNVGANGTSSATSSDTASRASNDASTSATASAQEQSNMASSTTTTVQFDRLDTNHDGHLDRQEFESGTRTDGNFSAVDRNDDQQVNREEFANRSSGM